MAARRSPKHSAAPAQAVGVGGSCSASPMTTTDAPASAATAYISERNTAGTLDSRTSRATPPPIPVSMPSSAAITGSRPNTRAFWAPATQNRASPAPSNSRTAFSIRLMTGYQKKIATPASIDTAR